MGTSVPAVRIQAATETDIPVIRAIALRAWPVAYADILSPGQLTYMLETRYSETVLLSQMERGEIFPLVFRDEQAMGFAGFEVNYQQRHITRLHKLYVDPEQKRTGLGRILLGTVIDTARQASDSAVNLNVNKYNPSLGFYKHMGFAVVGEDVLDIGRGYVMDDYILQLELGAGSALR